jgi:hypothetical protein
MSIVWTVGLVIFELDLLTCLVMHLVLWGEPAAVAAAVAWYAAAVTSNDGPRRTSMR